MSETSDLGAIGTRLLYQNAEVGVWEMQLAPGDVCRLHKHMHDYVIIYVTPDNELRVEWEGREGSPIEAPDGHVIYTTLGRKDELPAHRLRNVGTNPHRQVIVEFYRETSGENLVIENNDVAS
jgi:beta-alanine degradation protein BauB